MSRIAQPTVGKNKPETAVCTGGGDIDTGGLTLGLGATRPAALSLCMSLWTLSAMLATRHSHLFRLSKHVRISDWYYLNGYAFIPSRGWRAVVCVAGRTTRPSHKLVTGDVS